ncbi:MAG: hypothetical protein CMJ65_04930 [Planctomycetaceae bacterium]|nr:hypothetical protein [Planctomycetaceae bacterium]
MNLRRLLLQTLRYHWRSNLSVGLGVAAATAVIAGALIVGDSVKHSLLQMHLDRLGQIDFAVTGGDRFVRENLADEIAVASNDGFNAAPLLMMRGGLEARETDKAQGRGALRVGGVMVYGVDERFWKMTGHGSLAPPEPGQVILSEGVARELPLAGGQSVNLWMELPSAIPRDTLLGERDEDTIDLSLTVQTLIGDSDEQARRGVGRFGLNPSQQLPKLAFVALETLQEVLGMNARRVRNREKRRFDNFPGRVNAMVFHARDPANSSGSQLRSLLGRGVTLDDLGLTLRELPKRKYVALESNRMVLDEEFLVGENDANHASSSVLVHLANRLSNADDDTKYAMYSIIAGLDPNSASAPPFGPFNNADGLDVIARLPDREIVINRWLADDLGLDVGGTLRMTYHLVGSDGELPEEIRTFRVHGIVELTGAADDRGLTPHVPGITDVRSFRDWRQPFKMDLDSLTTRDEEYWERYRATPKGFVTLQTGQDLWESRYGPVTSQRFAVDPSNENAVAALSGTIRSGIELESLGLSVQAVKAHGVQAASGTTPFSGLFIGFSMFLIGAATILVGLLFRLGIERRGRSLGLVSSLGFSPVAVLRLFCIEGLVVVACGAVLGCVAGIGYAHLMVYGLTHWWVGAVGTTFLEVTVHFGSLLGGGVLSCLVAGLAIFVAAKGLLSLPARELLAGSVRAEEDASRVAGRSRKVPIVAAATVFTLLAISLVLPEGVKASEAFSGLSVRIVTFFLVGLGLLVVAVTGLSAFLATSRKGAISGKGLRAVLKLGFRNAARHRARSVLSVAMIATAAFLITAVASGRRNPVDEWPDRLTGGGGFLLVAESSQPLLYDPGTSHGRKSLELDERLTTGETELLEHMEIHSFRLKPGEESSCLNLYQTRQPTILGATRRTIARGGFRFVGADVENPWTLLEQDPEMVEMDSGKTIPVYPVIGDMNTLQYSLHKSVGQTISIPNDEAPRLQLKIVGMLDASVFQGVLVMSAVRFQQAFPDNSGFSYFLVADSRYGATGQKPGNLDALTATRGNQVTLLESRLREYGFDAEPVVERLGRFLAVQNTYLMTFQVLGGLGLLLGTVGLATVMLRNVLERRSELALLRAIGFRQSALRWLVLGENAFLLFWGLFSGTISALVAMSPHLASAGADLGELIIGLSKLLLAVLLAGMLAAGLAVAEAVRTPVVASLRSE